MRRSDVIWGVLYWVIILTLVWLSGQDGPSMKARFYYRMFRIAQPAARMLGEFGLHAEHRYFEEVKQYG
jgi:hypothetical protein